MKTVCAKAGRVMGVVVTVGMVRSEGHGVEVTFLHQAVTSVRLAPLGQDNNNNMQT